MEWNALLNMKLRHQLREIFLMGLSNILEDIMIAQS